MWGALKLKGVPESSCSVKLTGKNISLNSTTLLKTNFFTSIFAIIVVLFLRTPLLQKKIQNVELFFVFMIKYWSWKTLNYYWFRWRLIFLYFAESLIKRTTILNMLWLNGQFDTTSYFSDFRGSKVPLVLLSNRDKTCYNAI